MQNFMGKGDFVWFVGVVEDRYDPVELGRVRVRCFGWHTDDKDKIPTQSLPWAQVMNGVQSGSVSGLGFSPTGIVEGTWVVGFFMDGSRAQEPLVLGTIPGIPESEADPDTGFNDPTGKYPKWTDETDVSKAARADCDVHPARIKKETNRLSDSGGEIDIPTARPPKISSVAEDRPLSYYSFKSWTEKPAADGVISQYPHNHVFETEAGHLQEFDDTEGGVRYHRFHPTGTYEEIVNDGSKTVKVVGKNYEIILDDSNMYIKGDLNVTVEGTKRELIKGNYHLEVEGEVSMDFKQSWQTKVGFNQETEVGRDRATNIAEDDYLTLVTGNSVENISSGEKVLNVKRDYSVVTNEDYALTAFGNTQIFTTGDFKLTNLGVNVFTSKGNITLGTQGNMTQTVTGTLTETAATGNVTYTAGDINVNGISHVSHTHTDPAGIAGSETSTPN